MTEKEATYRFLLPTPSGYEFQGRFTIYSTELDGVHTKIDGTLYLGNPKQQKEDACVTISVHFPESAAAYKKKWGRNPLFDPSVASLVLTKHDTACSETKPLLSGKGTVEMITAGMSLIKQLCEFVTSIDLKDMSTRKCDNGASISLSYFYITIHKQTWYEKQFEASLRPESNMVAYREAVDTLLSMPLEPFASFSVHFLRGCNEQVKKAIKQAYDASNTMEEFFHTLYETHGIPMGCILVSDWLEKMMKAAKMQPYLEQEWYIDIKTIPSWRFSNESMTLRIIKGNRSTVKKGIWGGKRKTRRH